MSQESDASKCQSIYWNLISAVEAGDGLGPLITNELRHTIRCDHIADFSTVRTSFENEVTPSALVAIIQGKESPSDEKLADRAVYHYRTWLKENLCNALDWKSRLYYNTVFHWDKFAFGVGLAGGSMYKMAKEIGRKRTSNR